MNSELSWRKSSFSGGSGGNCVEVADHDGHVLVRDTKARDRGTVQEYPVAGWLAFVAAVRGRGADAVMIKTF